MSAIIRKPSTPVTITPTWKLIWYAITRRVRPVSPRLYAWHGGNGEWSFFVVAYSYEEARLAVDEFVSKQSDLPWDTRILSTGDMQPWIEKTVICDSREVGEVFIVKPE